MAQLLQPMRQTPAMQALQSNLPAARMPRGDRRIVPVNTVNREGIRQNVGEPVMRDPSFYVRNGGQQSVSAGGDEMVRKLSQPTANNENKMSLLGGAVRRNVGAPVERDPSVYERTSTPKPSSPKATTQVEKVSDPKEAFDTDVTAPTQEERRRGQAGATTAPRQQAPEAEDVDLAELPGGEQVGTPQLDENASVSGLLNQLMSEDSPYLQQARQRAAEAATARGLRNSTMAVQAGEQAAIDRALPIAQQDAQQQFSLQQAAVNQRLTERRDLLLNELQQNRDTRTFAMDMQRLEQEFQNQLSTIGVEMSQQNRTAYVQSSTEIMNSAMENVSMVYQNPNLSPEQQENAVRQIYRDLNKRMASLQDIYAPLPGVDFPEDEAPAPSPVQPGRDVPIGAIDGRYAGGGGLLRDRTARRLY